mgnify:CR=1 FL=1
MSKMLVTVAGLAIAAAASASNPGSVSGQGGSIPDNGGGSGNLFSSSVSAGANIVITGVSFQGLSHTWVGDLSMTLTGPGAGNSFNFFYRPGQTSATGFGQSGDFSAANAYSFSDGGAAWNTTTATVPSGNYAPIRSAFAPAQAINSFAGLNGSAAGTWTLTIGDNAAADTGSLTGWTLNYKVVPTPGAAALMGVAGLAGLRRRR